MMCASTNGQMFHKHRLRYAQHDDVPDHVCCSKSVMQARTGWNQCHVCCVKTLGMTKTSTGTCAALQPLGFTAHLAQRAQDAVDGGEEALLLRGALICGHLIPGGTTVTALLGDHQEAAGMLVELSCRCCCNAHGFLPLLHIPSHDPLIIITGHLCSCIINCVREQQQMLLIGRQEGEGNVFVDDGVGPVRWLCLGDGDAQNSWVTECMRQACALSLSVAQGSVQCDQTAKQQWLQKIASLLLRHYDEAQRCVGTARGNRKSGVRTSMTLTGRLASSSQHAACASALVAQHPRI